MHKRKLAVICISIAILTAGININAFGNSNSEALVNEQVIDNVPEEALLLNVENDVITDEQVEDSDIILLSAEETDVFSLNLTNITDRTLGAYAPNGTSAEYYDETENERQYLNIEPANGTVTVSTQYSKRLTTDGFIDFSARTKNTNEDAYISMQCGTSVASDLIKYNGGKWSVPGNTNIENTGDWMDFRILFKINDSGVYERKTLLKNELGIYEEVTGWEVTTLDKIQSARFTVGYMSLDIGGWRAVSSDVDGLYPKISGIEKLGTNSAKITFSRKMHEGSMKAEMVKIKENTVTGFTYDEENNQITIETEKEIVTDDIMFRMGMRADNGMPLTERISNTSLTVTGASIDNGAEVSVKAGKIEITVSQKLMTETVNKDNILFEGGADYTVSYDENNNKIIIEYDKLDADTGYRVVIGSGVLSVDGDFLVNDYVLNFTAIQVPFNVVEASVANNQTVGVKADKIEIYFSSKLDAGTLTEENIKLTKANGEKIRGIYTLDYDVTENKVIVEYGNLEENTGYTLKLSENIEDIEGGALTPYTLNFKTGKTAVYDYPMTSASETEKHILMTDEDKPYIRLSGVKYYQPDTSQTVTLDLQVRVGKAENHSLKYANYKKPDGTSGTWASVYSIEDGEWSFNGTTEKYPNDGEWTTLRIVSDKDNTDAYLQSIYMLNKDAIFEKVAEAQTEVASFNYSTYGGSVFDIRKMIYSGYGNGYLVPKVLKTDYTAQNVKIYFSADMNEESFTNETVKATDSEGKIIENAEIQYDKDLRMITVTAEGISNVELSANVTSSENMPIGDVSGNLQKNDFSVGNIGLTDGVGGDYITSLQGVETVSGGAFVTNNSQSDKNVTLFAVMYGKDNMIKKIAHQNETVEAGKKAYMNNAVLEDINAEEGDYVKVFVWDSAAPEEKPSPVREFVKIGF